MIRFVSECFSGGLQAGGPFGTDKQASGFTAQRCEGREAHEGLDGGRPSCQEPTFLCFLGAPVR
eukprot:12928724-Prorocentrum_lima.AAC.1